MQGKYIRVKLKEYGDLEVDTISISRDQGIQATVKDKVLYSLLFDTSKWDNDGAGSWVKTNLERVEWCVKNKGVDDIGWLFKDDYHIDLETGREYKMNPVNKSYSCELKDFNEDSRSFTAIASTETKDRDGDIMRIGGAKLKNFRKNPVMLFGHDDRSLAIGRADNIRKEDGRLVFDAVFASKEANPFAENVFQLFKEKIMRSFSIRFSPTKAVPIQPAPAASNEIMRFPGMEYKEWELLEISAVNIPANPEAMKNAGYRDFCLKSIAVENHINMPTEEKADEFDCECIECGHKQKSDKHCKDLKCAECGGQMRRAERPGPGQASYSGNLEAKEEQLAELKSAKGKIEREKEIDNEIAALTEELEKESDEHKTKELLSQTLENIKTGITGLMRK